MSLNVKKFITTDIYQWFTQNADSSQSNNLPGKAKFWVTPVDSKDPSYDEIVEQLMSRFSVTSVGIPRVIEGLALVVVREGSQVFVCGAYLDGKRSLVLADSLVEGVHEAELSFLQKMAFVCKVGAKAKSLIAPAVWQKMPIFQADFEALLPKIACIEIDEEFTQDSEEVLILKLLLSVELPATNVIFFRNELISVMLAVPQKDHEWLLQQVLWTAMSGRNTNFFVELYRIVEFFFPLKKISKLKEKIGFQGTDLELLGACSSGLGWNVNHSLGSRLALNFATTDFAEIALDSAYSGEKDEEARKFKEDAMEKITELRHALVHQSFRESSTEDTLLNLFTHALLNFLFTSFSEYGRTYQKIENS
ncbi:hypothetical protein [Herbaspirillum autotrophicum]|uniref:hypothetical protein n=1 Tax=Herbaspirillum autotrophicum TaxID=180195 RepID=UPI00067D5633|nr:hypothetical protein [Herbaspirillum autotrophicum]